MAFHKLWWLVLASVAEQVVAAIVGNFSVGLSLLVFKI